MPDRVTYGDIKFDIERRLGRMNDPTCTSFLTGPCGDSMEFYLVLRDGRIEDVNYFTDGCAATRTCAAVAAELCLGRTVREALRVSAGGVLDRIDGLPEDHRHCAILAVSALYRAVAEYLLMP